MSDSLDGAELLELLRGLEELRLIDGRLAEEQSRLESGELSQANVAARLQQLGQLRGEIAETLRLAQNTEGIRGIVGTDTPQPAS